MSQSQSTLRSSGMRWIAKPAAQEDRKIIARQDALQSDLKRYFTGRPCKHGHLAERLVSNCSCLECAAIHDEAIGKEVEKRWRQKNAAKLKAQRAAWNAANKEHKSEYDKIWREVNQSRIKARRISYYQANKDTISARNARWAKDNPERSAAIKKAWVENNRDRKNAFDEAWRRNNRARYLANTLVRANRRRARKTNAGGHFTRHDVIRIGIMQRWRCASCGRACKSEYQVDHILPIALGGSSWPNNLQILCAPCNSKKRAKHPIEWARENGRLI